MTQLDLISPSFHWQSGTKQEIYLLIKLRKMICHLVKIELLD
jgi:hypothetical protein